MAEKEYLIRLGERARKRHYHKTDKGNLLAFIMQLEVEVEDGIWKPVIRYNLKGDQDKQEIALSYAESLDLADKDINDNWDIYQERFLRGDYP